MFDRPFDCRPPQTPSQAFRVNRVYLRWSGALQAFGSVGTSTVTLAQQAVLWVPDEYLQVGAGQWLGCLVLVG